MGMGSGGNYSDKQSQRLEEVPELEQWNREFWRPKGIFFQKTGILGQNREFNLGTREPLENPWAGHADFETPAPPTRSNFAARSLDRSTRPFSVVSPLLAAPCIPSCGPAFDRSAASHQPGGHTSLFAPRVKLGLSTSSETSSL
jgi:hypothetical protein